MKLLAWHCREALSLNMTFHLEQHQSELQAQDVGPGDPGGATQEIILTVNFLVVYPAHPKETK